jgi:hypothetical protein
VGWYGGTWNIIANGSDARHGDEKKDRDPGGRAFRDSTEHVAFIRMKCNKVGAASTEHRVMISILLAGPELQISCRVSLW